MLVATWFSVSEEEDGLVTTALEDGLGPTPATLARQWLPPVSHGTLCTMAVIIKPLHLMPRQAGCWHTAVSPGINVCELWDEVHKVLVLIKGGFHLLFYLREEGNNASCIRSKEFELFYYLLLMKVEQMG